GWTTTFLSAAAVTLVVFVIAALLLRDAPADSGYRPVRTDLRETRASLASAWRHPGTRLGFWTHFTVQFSGMLFVLIWGYPYLVQGQGLSPGRAGAILASMVPAGILMGFVLGRLSATRPQARIRLVGVCLAATVGAWTTTLLWPG